MKTNTGSRSARAAAVFALIWLLPVVFALVDRYVIDFAIGPVVLFYSVVSVFAFAAASAWGLAPRLGAAKALFAGIVIGVLSGVLLLNFFMWFTAILGIKDYEVI